MGIINIISWNSQGGARQGEKFDALSRYVGAYNQSGEDCVIFLQEAGTPTPGGTGFEEGKCYPLGGRSYYCAVVCPDPIAQVQRCTVTILVNMEFYNKNVTKAGYLEHGAFRPIPCVLVNDQYILAGMHAIADSRQSVTEVNNIISHLDNDKKKRKWILVGDFNAEPECHLELSEQTRIVPGKLNPIRYGGTKSRPQLCNMLYPAQPTQGAGGYRTATLDYAFMEINFKNEDIVAWRNEIVYSTSIPKRILSDHNMISMRITIE